MKARTVNTTQYENHPDPGNPLTSEKERLRADVLHDGLSLKNLVAENPLAYQEDCATLDKLRIRYISERAPMPETRTNFHVEGTDSIRKAHICRAIARGLYPTIKDDNDIFFEVGKTGIDGYDGQPVIIWSSQRAIDLSQKLNGKRNMSRVFDTCPARKKRNTKSEAINLCNEINIVNSAQSFVEFMDELVGEKQNKDTNEQEYDGQCYRQLPFFVPLHEADLALLMKYVTISEE